MPYRDESEYGGTGALIEPVEKGHVRMSTGERRMVAAIWDRRSAGQDPNLPEGDLHKPHTDAVYADLPTRTAGRLPEEEPGERIG